MYEVTAHPPRGSRKRPTRRQTRTVRHRRGLDHGSPRGRNDPEWFSAMRATGPGRPPHTCPSLSGTDSASAQTPRFRCRPIPHGQQDHAIPRPPGTEAAPPDQKAGRRASPDRLRTKRGTGKGSTESPRRCSDPKLLPGQSRGHPAQAHSVSAERLTSASSRPCPRPPSVWVNTPSAPLCKPLGPKRNRPQESK